MRTVNPFLLAGLVILSNACRPPTTVERTITVSLNSSLNKGPFYSRFATDEHGQRLVVAPPSGQLSGIDIVLGSNELIFVTEFTKEPNLAIDGELYRTGRLVVHKARDLREAYLQTKVTGEEPHPRPVDVHHVVTPESETVGARIIAANTDDFHPITLSVDPIRIKEDLESLSGAKPVTVNGQTFTLTHRASVEMKHKARLWLRSVYEDLGFTVKEHSYGSGTNFIAEKTAIAPVDDQILIVSGHLDTVQTPGADDDGSGVISSLSIARAISHLPLTRTIRFVAFDEEERGLLGSSAYVRELSKTGEIRRVSVINIEMTGYDSDDDGEFHAIDCDENTSNTLTHAVTEAIRRDGLALNKIHACTNRSDHAIFWDYDRPAIVISQNFFGGDSNPCYHKKCDSTQAINWSYMEKLTRASATAVASLVSAAP